VKGGKKEAVDPLKRLKKERGKEKLVQRPTQTHQTHQTHQTQTQTLMKMKMQIQMQKQVVVVKRTQNPLQIVQVVLIAQIALVVQGFIHTVTGLVEEGEKEVEIILLLVALHTEIRDTLTEGKLRRR